MKDFFENPELLLAWPLIVIAAAGMLVVLGAMFMYWINPNPTHR
jgi:hypothetical protein